MTSELVVPLTDKMALFHFSPLYDALSNYFLRWYLLLILLIGSVGNILCLCVLTSTTIFPKIVKIWLISMSTSDLLFLWTDSLWMCIKVYTNFDFRDTSLFVCKGHNFVSNYFLYFSAYMQAAVSIQRAIFIKRPFRARRFFTVSRVISVWIALSIVSFLPTAVYLTSWRLDKKSVTDGSLNANTTQFYSCKPPATIYYYVTSILDLVLWCGVPVGCITASSIVICTQIRARSNSMLPETANMSGNPSKRKLLRPIFAEPHSLQHHRTLSSPFTQLRKRIDKRFHDVYSPNVFPRKPHPCSSLPDSFKSSSNGSLSDELNSKPKLNSYLKIHRKSQTLENTTNPKRLKLRSPSQVNFSPASLSNRLSPNIGGLLRREETAAHVTRLLLSMNIWYTTCSAPLILYLLVLNFVFGGSVGVDITRDVHRFCYYFLRALVYLTCCGNFVFYCISGSMFRNELLRYLSECRKTWNNLARRLLNMNPKYHEPTGRYTFTSRGLDKTSHKEETALTAISRRASH